MSHRVYKLKNIEDYVKNVLQRSDKKLVIIKYFATWCGHCKNIAPDYAYLSVVNPDVEFYEVDINAAEQLAAMQNINSTPIFHAYRNGKLIGEVQGADKKKLYQLVYF